MKTAVSTQLAILQEDREMRRNIRALARYLLIVLVTVLVYSIFFQVIMITVEGQSHSWASAFYWTIVTMTTLGFGDITFQTDIGRLFSTLVLLSGVIMLLVVLPYAFIRYFYAPWLEAQIHRRAPQRVPDGTKDHIIITEYNENVARGLIERLEHDNIPYFVIEPDPKRAADLYRDDISVVKGDVDLIDTYEALCVKDARALIINGQDTVNTNVILTVRELAPDVETIAISNYEESIDVLELSGASHVLPLKKWLGEQLANRVSASHTKSHVIGRYGELVVAELPAHHTPLAGVRIRDTTLRKASGINILGLWQRGKFVPARPELEIADNTVLVIMGTDEQLDKLDDLLAIYDINPHPVLLIGAGRVGRAVARALHEKGVSVNLIERDEHLCEKVSGVCNTVIAGDAADYELLVQGGIKETPTVILTTHDDAMNIFLSSYCRRLNSDLRIVSRITHERNLNAIHRAGADFVLSYSSFSVDALFSLLEDKEFIILGEGVDLFPIMLPQSLYNTTLIDSKIGEKTGLTVVAVRQNDSTITDLSTDTTLRPDMELLVVGNPNQREVFFEEYGRYEEATV